MEHYTGLVPAVDRPTAIVLGVAIVSAAAIAPKLLRPANNVGKFPLIGKELGGYYKRLMAFVYNTESLYRKGYAQFRNGIWRLTTVDGERIVVPSKYLDELRQMSDDQISMTRAIDINIESKFSGMSAEAHFINHVVRADLTRNLPRMNASLCDEIDHVLQTELPACSEWTSVCIHEKMPRIVAMVSGRIFLGPELCRREEYLHASINYTIDAFKGIAALKMWPRLLRHIGALFTPQLRAIGDHKERAKRFLLPVIQERRQLMSEGRDLPDDMLSWMLVKADDPRHARSDEDLAVDQLQLSLAAIHTTTGTGTHVLYDIISVPGLVKELREEIHTVLKEFDGVFTTKALFEMKLLDSVLNESQRMNSLTMKNFERYVQKPVTLKDGTEIPADTIIEAPTIAILRDATYFPEPDKFDPYRFYRLRSGETKDPIGYSTPEQYQFVSVTKEHMGFGFGRHACPGRFFAANELKLILARLILDFDMTMPAGQTERFPNVKIAGNQMPDGKREIMMRKVPSSAERESKQ